MIIFSNNIIETVLYAFDIWKNNIFPSLFPFFIVSDLLMNYGFVEILGELLKNIIKRVFNLPKESAFVIVSSMLNGSPSSAKYTKELLEKGTLSTNQAQHLIAFTHFPNPIFITGSISILLNNKNISIIILISIIISNFLTGIILRTKCYDSYSSKEKVDIKKCLYKIYSKNKNNNFIKILSNSIYQSINTLLLILGVIIFFLMITNVINEILQFSDLTNSILSGIIEMTQGIKKVASMNISISFKVTLITIFMSFGGLSVHMQTKAIKKYEENSYLLGRIINSSISGIIVQILLRLYLSLT